MDVWLQTHLLSISASQHITTHDVDQVGLRVQFAHQPAEAPPEPDDTTQTRQREQSVMKSSKTSHWFLFLQVFYFQFIAKVLMTIRFIFLGLSVKDETKTESLSLFLRKQYLTLREHKPLFSSSLHHNVKILSRTVDHKMDSD